MNELLGAMLVGSVSFTNIKMGGAKKIVELNVGGATGVYIIRHPGAECKCVI